MSASGNIEIDGVAYLKQAAIDPNDTWGWAIYRDSTSGGHFYRHTTDGHHYDLWATSGTRSWVGSSILLMQLDGSGNLNVYGTLTPGRVLLTDAAGDTIDVLQELLQLRARVAALEARA